MGATATTAASGGNREELLGPRPAGCERQRSRRWEPQPGCGAPLAKPFTLRGLPKPPLGRGGGSASALTERLRPAAAHGQALSSYNLSVCFADSSPSRGASGEEAKLYGMPKPPLDRSNGDDRRQRRKQGGAVGAAASRMRGPHQGPKQTLGAATRAVSP